MPRARSTWWFETAPWFAAACVVLTGSWAADGIKDGVEALLKGDTVKTSLWGARACYMGSFCLAAYWLYCIRQRWLPPRTQLMRNEVPEKRGHLIMFLSQLDTRRSTFHEGILEELTLTTDLQADLKMLCDWKQKHTSRWAWEMPLRGIAYHLGHVKTVTFLCSPESIQQVHWFGAILARYPALQGLDIRVFVGHEDRHTWAVCPTTPLTQGGWNFEQFDDLSRAVTDLLQVLHRRRIRDYEIMIDFTGGQKVTSVVAASLTFNRAIKAQYVQTNEPYNVISYDNPSCHLLKSMGFCLTVTVKSPISPQEEPAHGRQNYRDVLSV